jgi:alpha-amylase/alpha-mannosidase (GH57 family)
MRRQAVLQVAMVLALAACTEATTTTTTAPEITEPPHPWLEEDPGFYLMLMWHQHQPLYPKDEEGVYTRPWVRVHATKDYYDMVAMFDEYLDVTATFNLTPTLLLQLEDLAQGAKDIYWTLAEVPAEELTEEQQEFILARFFDINPRVVARFPRYQELADARGSPFTVEELRDLQVLFNLGWTDPDFLEEEPLRSLVAKGRGFSEEDKAVLFAEHQRIIAEVIPIHTRLWEEGRIEVTTTPLAHPILPLLADTNLAVVGDPAALMPENRFQEVLDADQQVIRGLDTAERILGRRPVGMWPAEGAVAQPIMSLFSKNGVRWVATGEDVLAQTSGIGSFTRDSADTVEEAELLHLPWSAQLRRNDPVAMFFRDVRISDQIGFEYSGMSGEAAVADFMRRLANIRDSLDVAGAFEAGRPHVVSVILDGENAWEHYENDGKEFLHALYRHLSEADWVQTITPTAYLDRFGEPEPLPEVFPASWFQPNFATWIGEAEEATAWDYLYQARQDLRRAEQSGDVPEEALARAYQSMLFAQGSDWFWWFGDDQDSGDDPYFDRAFREHLRQMYEALGEDPPLFVSVPIIPEVPLAAERTPADLVTPADGMVVDWDEAGRYILDPPVEQVSWGFDTEHLYLQVAGPSLTSVVIHLGTPHGERTPVADSGAPLGFGATHRLVLEGDQLAGYALPLSELGSLEPGDLVLAKLEVAADLYPAVGPMAFQVPDISDVEVFLEVEDPIGDDHGPGTYTYPTDPVFIPGSYDLRYFSVGTDREDLVLSFEMVAPIHNPWGSPRGFSVQTFDVYVDVDPGAATGSRLLLPGRNAALSLEHGWEYAITIEGWEPALYVSTPDGRLEETKPTLRVVNFGDRGRVVIRVPLHLLDEGDPSTWGYAAVVLSQEGFPSPGVRRVRDVHPTAQQWRLGGAPPGINHTRIIDVAWPIPEDQEELLSTYPPVTSGTVDDLGPDDFGVVPLLIVE